MIGRDPDARDTFEVDCIVCFDRGVIHFTGLAPSNRHEPVPGVRFVPLKGQVWTRDATTRASLVPSGQEPTS